MFEPAQNIVVFDTEFTSWEGAMERHWSGENEHRELIQIGAVVVDTVDFQERNSFCVYVKPFKNPSLSEYITSLTGITQRDVDEKGLSAQEALMQLNQFSQGSDLYCWGSDGDVALENASLGEFQCPIAPERFHDIREVFIQKGIDATAYQSSSIITAFGKENPHDAHDALNDARAIVLALQQLRR